MGKLRLWSALVLVAALAGCAHTVPRQAFNREAATHIKSVIVARGQNQDRYEAAILGHPGMGFGLIGGLVAAADIQSKSNRLTAAINPAETRLQDRFSAKLSDELTRAGYAVTVVTLPNGTKVEDGLTAATQQARGDAVLTVMLFGGYWAAGPSTDYFPRVFAKVRTQETAKGNVLYEDSISYGYAMPNAQTVHLASDERFRFHDMDELTRDPGKTREGLYNGVDAIVAQIVADLRKE